MARTSTIDAWRGIGLLMAVFALGLRLVIPAGFMPGDGADGRTGLVICMAGPGAPDAERSHMPGQHAPEPDAPCAFAGAAAAPPVDLFTVPAAVGVAYHAPVPATWRDLAPGRGLSAPPPPSQGPPTLLA